MKPSTRVSALHFGAAIGSVLLTSALHHYLLPHVGSRITFSPYFPAVMFSAWYGGFGPAIVATILGGCSAAYLILEPQGAIGVLHAEDQGSLVLYVVVALGMAWFGGAMRAAREHERDARLLAQEADRRKDEFLAMLAHELRNPLVPLRNGLHVLGQAGHDPKLIDHTRAVMERQLEHLVRLVDDLLDVSRVVSNRVELKCETVDAADVVYRAVELTRPTLDARGLRLVLNLPAESVFVRADAVRLCQVLGNLLQNAAKFTDPGGRVTVTVAPTEHQIRITVRDTGHGIDSRLLPRVFDLFVQADQALARTQGGLGIGLTICRRLIELHGGQITATSPGPGQGSEFVVELPREFPLVSAVQEKVNSRPDGQPARGPATHRVLVVDDNVDAAESLAMVLRATGHEVAVAFDGPTALKEARRFQPSAVLLDLGLPGLDGYAVARQLRSEPTFKNVFLAALTGYGHDDDRRRSHESGFDLHLVKPVEPMELQQVLARTTPVTA